VSRSHLTRREVLAGAVAGAAILVWRPGVAAVRATRPAAPARRASLIRRRVLFDDPDRSIVRISPDGTRIAFLAPVGGVLNLWVGPIENVAKARAVTRVTDRSLGPWVVWLHDNRHVVFFREQGGDENWQAHRIDLVSGEVRALTPGPGVKSYVQQRSRHFPSELLIGHNQRDARYHDLYRVDVASGESTLIQKNEGFASHFTDSQFRVRFAVRHADDGSTEYLERDPSGDWTLFTRVDMTDAMTTRPIEFSDDGTELFWLDSRGRDKAAVVAQSLEAGATRVLAEDVRADVVELTLEPSSHRPLAAMSMFARRRWQPIDPAYASDLAALSRVSAGDVGGFNLSLDARHWIVHYERDAAAAQVFHYDRVARKARWLFTTRRALAKAPLVPMESAVVRARDDLELLCYLSRPRGEDRSPLNHVDRIVRPLLIGQGANDARVKPSESEQIVAAMKERKIPITYVYYSDEGHGFRRPENRRSFTAVAEAFLARHLGGRFEPVGDDFAGSTIEFKSGRDLIPALR
jgi:dipeptidyl aminopeptidase/acylaminoacyl peptidase